MANAREVKQSLIEQLKAKGADVALYRAQIDDYMWFFQQERQMQADIRKNGRKYLTASAAGKEYEKENPCVKNALLYSKQMVTILAALGLNTESVVGGGSTGGDADDDL